MGLGRRNTDDHARQSIAHSFPAISFNYVVRLYAFNDCGDTVQVICSLNEIGLEELNNTFSLYPNPNSTELLNVVFPNEASQCEICLSGEEFIYPKVP